MAARASAITNRLRVFIASPNDVADERDRAEFVVDELRRTIGESALVDIQAIRSETHTWPDVGEDAQDVVNRQVGPYDIFVGMMWKRIGTRTRRAVSGTAEEVDRALKLFRRYGRPKILFYFRIDPFYPETFEDLTQFKGVLQFKKKLTEAGVSFRNYVTPLEFERLVREHLIRHILTIIDEIQ